MCVMGVTMAQFLDDRMLQAEESCQCLAIGEENEDRCEGKDFDVETCFAQAGLCQWGPEEVPICLEQGSPFRSETEKAVGKQLADP